MPKRLCSFSGCRNVVEGGDGSRCPEHPHMRPKKRIYDHHYHQGKHIYSSTRWKRVRASYLQYNPLCCDCEQFGIATPATVVDHIVEIKDGGDPWEWDNFQGLCRNCHQRKTGMEQRKRKQKKNNNGFASLSDF